MRSDWVRKFIRMARHDEAMFADAEIQLRPREYVGYSRHIHCEHTFVFDVVQAETGCTAGEIALRIGESREQFYLGHIGYHIDPPFRGHMYATAACRLAAPLLTAFGMRTAVITTDPTNRPSINTCLRLGCELESTVQVPPPIREKLEISDVKRRYVWTLQ